MTISTTTSRWEGVGNGSTTVFPYNNKIFDTTDLRVYLDGVLQTLTTHYTVSGAGTGGGGNVTFLTPPGVGASVVIVRAVANTQLIDYPAAGAFPSVATEDGLDRRTIVSQQHASTMARSLQYLESDANLPSATLPPLADLKGRYLQFNATTGAPEAGTLSTTSLSRAVTPYDYGVVAGSELTVDNSVAINAMFAACAASYDASFRVYTLVPHFNGVRFRCDDEIWVGGTRAPGFRIFGGGGGIYSKAVGKFALNLALCNRPFIQDFTIWGDATSPPAYGFYWGKALEGSTYPDARGVSFTNCMAQGYYTECAALGFASETHSQVNCLWQNKSRSLTAMALALVGHRSSIDNYFSTFTSANCTLPTVALGTQSNLGHDLHGVHVERGNDFSLTVVSIPNGATTTVTVTTGTLAGAALSNGDKVRFSVTGMTQLRVGDYEIENLDEDNDRFDLVGIDSTSYGTFGAGTMQNATGPAMLINGAHDFSAETLYTLAYADTGIIFDMSVGSALRNFRMNVQPERWNDQVFEMVAPASGTATCQSVHIVNMSSNQQYGSSVFKYTGAGNITINNGTIEVTNLGTAPPNLLFDDASKLTLSNVAITSQIAALLNPASDYLGYGVVETAFDRTPRTKDYRSLAHLANPTFETTSIATAAGTAKATDATATIGPIWDIWRESSSAAAQDIIGAIQLSGSNDAAQKTSYAKLRGKIVDPTDSSEEGGIDITLIEGGTEKTAVSFTYGQTLVVSDDAGATAGPFFTLDRNSASPLAGDLLGQVSFTGRDSGGNSTRYGSIRTVVVDPTDGSEDGRLHFVTQVAGVETAVGTADFRGLTSLGDPVATSDGTTGATTTPNGTVTVVIGGTTYYLLTAATS